MGFNIIDTIPYFIVISLIIYLGFKWHSETFTNRSIYNYDYNPSIGSIFDKDQMAMKPMLEQELKKENTTQLVGNLFLNNTLQIRKNMTAPDITYLPHKQTIFDYSDIVL
jgi:hypothetical protein